MNKILIKTVLLIVVIFCTGYSFAQQLAFPGAESAGRFTTGGRGGIVYEVTNLNDDGAGSLRYGLETLTGARTIIFKVSGTIALTKQLQIKNGNVTIAGQTAPGDGICIKGYGLEVKSNNVIARYLHCRPGDYELVEVDAFGGRGYSNIIIDHCSVSWSVDEIA